MNDQLPALILMMIAMMMFGAFECYNIPWLFRLLGVFVVCGIPLLILIVSSYLRKRNKKW